MYGSDLHAWSAFGSAEIQRKHGTCVRQFKVQNVTVLPNCRFWTGGFSYRLVWAPIQSIAFSVFLQTRSVTNRFLPLQYHQDIPVENIAKLRSGYSHWKILQLKDGNYGQRLPLCPPPPLPYTDCHRCTRDRRERKGKDKSFRKREYKEHILENKDF